MTGVRLLSPAPKHRGSNGYDVAVPWRRTGFDSLAMLQKFVEGERGVLALSPKQQSAGSSPVFHAKAQVAQSVERLSEEQSVGGSIPSLSTIAALAQPGRASALHTLGREFDSLRRHQRN